MTMQPDLTQPGAAEAFEMAVSLAVEAAVKGDEPSAFRVGAAFAHLHRLLGGQSETYQPLKDLVRAAAAESICVAAGVKRPS